MYSALINEKNNKYMQCIKLSDNALKLACTCFLNHQKLLENGKGDLMGWQIVSIILKSKIYTCRIICKQKLLTANE